MPDPKKQQKQAMALDDKTMARLVREYAEAVKTAEAEIRSLTAKAQQRAKDGLPVPPSWALEQDRLRSLQQQVRAELVRLNTTAETLIVGAKREAVGLAQSHTDAWVGANYQALNTRAVEAIVARTKNGTPLSRSMAQYPAQAARRIERTLVQAVALGYGPDRAARLLRREMGGPLTKYMTITRTEVMGAYNSAAVQTYRLNQDVIVGWEWIVEDDEDLCPFCAARAGRIYPLSEEFDTHPNCRCTSAPKVRD